MSAPAAAPAAPAAPATAPAKTMQDDDVMWVSNDGCKRVGCVKEREGEVKVEEDDDDDEEEDDDDDGEPLVVLEEREGAGGVWQRKASCKLVWADDDLQDWFTCSGKTYENTLGLLALQVRETGAVFLVDLKPQNQRVVQMGHARDGMLPSVKEAEDVTLRFTGDGATLVLFKHADETRPEMAWVASRDDEWKAGEDDPEDEWEWCELDVCGTHYKFKWAAFAGDDAEDNVLNLFMHPKVGEHEEIDGLAPRHTRLLGAPSQIMTSFVIVLDGAGDEGDLENTLGLCASCDYGEFVVWELTNTAPVASLMLPGVVMGITTHFHEGQWYLVVYGNVFVYWLQHVRKTDSTPYGMKIAKKFKPMPFPVQKLEENDDGKLEAHCRGGSIIPVDFDDSETVPTAAEAHAARKKRAAAAAAAAPSATASKKKKAKAA